MSGIQTISAGNFVHQSRQSHASLFDEQAVLHELKHYLPAQAPLKDFIHHNTLHAFQHLKFDTAIRQASEMLGYKVSLSLAEYRELYQQGRISEAILSKVIVANKGLDQLPYWQTKVFNKTYAPTSSPRIGMLRAHWKRQAQIDLDALVHPTLFRILCSYLDQGIASWNFPVTENGFLASLQHIEQHSFSSFFRTKRARTLLLKGNCTIPDLLAMLVGDETLYQQYLFDQQFAHQGWSGLVSAVEDNPESLLDLKAISLRDLIFFELLLEIDALDANLGQEWVPLAARFKNKPQDLFAPVPPTELNDVLAIWQEAFEWTYYDQVLAGIKMQPPVLESKQTKPTFQALFCIDDRECSIRRYLEKLDPHCETFGTPGFFGVEFFFQPENGRFYSKQCPAPVTPKFLIKEEGSTGKRTKEVHFAKHTHSLFGGWLISQTLGFWSAFKLLLHIFRPTMSAGTSASFNHMDKVAKLTIENESPAHKENNLQIGFTVDEMADRVEGLLRSIGLVKDFAPLVYVVGHGSSTINNPHYAAYDCGACSGRPGSVNARVVSYMANHPKVRQLLNKRGLPIPMTTHFVGALHDTTRDEIAFYDEIDLTLAHRAHHHQNSAVFEQALDLNAKERSRRFSSINSKLSPAAIHEAVRKRSVSLFQPRPELNHATNALSVIGRRSLTKNLFLDRRALMNSYNYALDPDGKYLHTILKAATPVCGGINLEYYFSRVDNQKLGAGTKLPHNVMGLFGVANGIDGDLRPGLPSQMIEMHDPIRMLFIVEHFPEVVLQAIQQLPATYEWYQNDWVKLVVVQPETRELFYFQDGRFSPYEPVNQSVEVVPDLMPLIQMQEENLPVYVLSQA